jgi:flagellin-like hook-associated protein FlgL
MASYVSNISALKSKGRLDQALAKTATSFERLSSGSRINKASDDAASLAVSSLLKLDSRVYSQGVRNLNDGISSLNIADGALSSLNDILSRIQELAQQSANGVLTSKQSESLQKEASALQSEYNRVLLSTKFNGSNLLTGENTRTTFQGGYGSNGTLTSQIGKAAVDGAIDNLAGSTSLISNSTTTGSGNGASTAAMISLGGEFIVFQSSASNLVAGDTNGQTDIFLKNLTTGVTSLVSTDSNGVQANGNSESASISADGRYILFTSYASNLVSGDTNGVRDVFLKDLATGVTSRVSTSQAGAQGNGQSYISAITTDGRFALFQSAASNLVTGDTNAVMDVFRKDLVTGEIIRVSTDSSGVQGNAFSSGAVASADGRFVAFLSTASNLVSGDTNGFSDVFIKDVETGNTRRISTSASGEQANHNSFMVSISANGRYAAFYSQASNLVSNDLNSQFDSFWKDTETGEIINVNSDLLGNPGDISSVNPQISADGMYVAFWSNATNIVSNDTNGQVDVFRKSIETGVTERVNTSTTGIQADAELLVNRPSMAANANLVVFDSLANNLSAQDSGGSVSDVYLRDLSKAGIQELSGIVVSDKTSARITLDMVKTIQSELSGYQSIVGATISRANIFASNLGTLSTNLADAHSRITDADIAEESSQLIANQILQQAATAINAQANQQPTLLLKLLS